MTLSQSFAGLSFAKPLVMGILNVTPDSFTDAGVHFDTSVAIDNGLTLMADGANIIDIGGESTRPGAEPVTPEEELQRVLPVVEALAGAGAMVSIDTRHALVMKGAIKAGAQIINDVSALAGDPDSMSVAAESEVPVILMHMKGEPKTMADDPHYDDVVTEVSNYLGARIAACVEAGISKDRLAIDPGFGFGKSMAHNTALLDNLDAFTVHGRPILVGLSRKFKGSLGAAVKAIRLGANIVRVHDIAETVAALREL